MGFDAYSHRLAEAVMRHLADSQSAIFTPYGGEPVTVSVILERDVARTVAGMQGVIMESRNEITGYANELGSASRGDVVTVDGKGWRLSQKDSDDGHLVTWIVTEERQ